MTSIWVAELHISDATANKIAKRHGISADEVRLAVLCVPGLTYSWDIHPERGKRAIIATRIRGFKVLVVLYPRVLDAFGDSWNLGSAYPING